MINKKYLELLRSHNRFDVDNFIYNTIAKRITDSLDLLNIKINNSLEIGINDNVTLKYLENRFIKSKIDRADISPSKNVLSKNYTFYQVDLDNIKLRENYYNLIYSNFFLHLTNNFELSLKNIFKSLCSDGFFITVIPSGESMFQLLNAMYETDLYFYSGVFQRFNPTVEIDNILPLMKILEFDSPSIYKDTITIDYKVFDKLLKDVKNMNLSYSHLDKKQNFENKNYFNKLEKIYRKKYFNLNYNLDIKINVLSAWKK
ncbi:class I SAM-dependent methyltransferase [Pelagibacteraceae bacterium]|nr:class I SAM-dependent methyltransferase [Pelagibacteraceae bacterium]